MKEFSLTNYLAALNYDVLGLGCSGAAGVTYSPRHIITRWPALGQFLISEPVHIATRSQFRLTPSASVPFSENALPD